MIINEKFNYQSITRETNEETGFRTYLTPDGHKVPSVTTIIDKTSDKTHLVKWRNRVGQKEAKYITNLSANIGTSIHKHLECHMLGEDRPEGTSYIRKHAKLLADIVIEKGLSNVNEIWGIEKNLYTDLYAGTADLIGLWKGEPAIIDFKNTRKPKKEEWLTNYYLQLQAYRMAHNEMFGTEIQKGIILMISREESHFGEFQIFEVDLNEWELPWALRLQKYYESI